MPEDIIPEDLTPEDIEEIKTLLSSPLTLPQEFKDWLPDWLATNLPPIPVSQLLGYRGLRYRYDVTVTRDNVTTPEHVWTALPTAGPEITGMADGKYWAAWGYHAPGEHAGMSEQYMGLSINGADPTKYCKTITQDTGKTVWRADVFDVKNGLDNNTVTAEYQFALAGGAEAQFQRRWMILLRIS